MESDPEIMKADPPPDETSPTSGAEDAQQNHHHHHHRHPPMPFLHHHHRHHQQDPGASSADVANNDKGKEKEKPPPPPPIPSHHRGLPFSKKPPPAPKARRRRGRDGSGDSAREPGKFSTNLPSIVTTMTSGQKVPEQSPFSPLDKTLSPTESASTSTIDSRKKQTVGEALEQAQATALEEIQETLEHMTIKVTNPPDTEEGETATLPTLPEEKRDDLTSDDPIPKDEHSRRRPTLSRGYTQEEIDQPYHDAVTDQTLSQGHTRSTTPAPSYLSGQSRALSTYSTNDDMATPPESMTPGLPLASPSSLPTITDDHTDHQHHATPQPAIPLPRMVLTPPAQESRGVPGPQFEMERSPFLTDEEVEEVDNGAEGEETELTEDDDDKDPSGARKSRGDEVAK